MAMAELNDWRLPVFTAKFSRHSILSSLLCLVLFLSCITGDIPRPRGVSISKASLYQVNDVFKCLDGSGEIPFEQVNDDYCDCRDSSDEPGTSACPNGSFHCTNAGHRPENIPSSRVNDGICDCCDGADEFQTKQCGNSCKELGRAAQEEAERLRQLLEEGHKVYQEYCTAGELAVKEKMNRKAELEIEKSALKNARDELEVVKNEAETPENDAKARHQQAWEETKKAMDEDRQKAESIQAFLTLDSDGDTLVSVAEMQTHLEFDIDSNGEVSPEEAKEYLEDREKVDSEFFDSEVWQNIREIYQKPSAPSSDGDEGTPPPPVEDSPNIPLEDDEHYYDEEEEEELDEPVEEEKKIDPQMPEYDEETKNLIEIADKAREEFDDADKKYKDVEREYNDLNQFLEVDFGPNKEFYSLRDQCFEYTDLQYVYKMCAFERTTQRAKSGGSEHNLGRWGHWDGPENNQFSAMKYDKGQNCWNGPDRSTKVILSCGMSNQLLGASEPNRCEYEFQFQTPAACAVVPMATKNHDEL